MPHLVLEYSSNLKPEGSFEEFLLELQNILCEHASAELESCKSRAYSSSDFVAGAGSKDRAFAHLQVSLLEGRTVEQKKAAGELLLKRISEFFKDGAINLKPSVEIREMNIEAYFK